MLLDISLAQNAEVALRLGGHTTQRMLLLPMQSEPSKMCIQPSRPPDESLPTGKITQVRVLQRTTNGRNGSQTIFGSTPANIAQSADVDR
jgi:hypothetical protein